MSKHLPMEQFDRNARAALKNTVQRRALHNMAELFGERRSAAVDAVPEWEEWRTQARAVKDHVLAHLDHYLSLFAERAEAEGAVVHWARDAKEACAIIVGLAQQRDARLAVKGKSMTSEEVHLNDALAHAGVEAVETDLGEWIVQLADEVPSHIIVPAIHKTKEQIAELFADKVGTEPGADVEELTRAARRVLRAKFAAADLGFSGANFGIAETGSLLIVENEGNVRFSTSLPRLHVALMGIEKVLPRLADLDVFLRLLPRSGTGQHLTSYMSLLTGPKRAPDQEGPDEVHIVLLDNGRSRMLAQSITRQSLACIRCGACLNACPVYRQVGGHAYGSVYPGPIGSVITPQLQGRHQARQLPFASSLCGACLEVCPVKIDIPELLLHLRSEVLEGSGQEPPAVHKRMEKLGFWVWAWAMAGPRRYRWATAMARVGQKMFMPLASRLVAPVRAWTRERELRPLAKKSFRALWRAQEKGRK